MKIIKLSTPWNHDFYAQTPEGKGVYGDYKFEIDNECQECDYWVVWGNLKKPEKVKCRPDNVFYLTDESHEQRIFNQEFLNQFAAIFTPRNDVFHSNVIKTHDLGIWHFKKKFDSIKSMELPLKQKVISAVSSDFTWLPGHKKRFAFINQLIGHYKDKIDFYGRGINPINDKVDALLPYQYSIAVENSYLEDYFTEKLFECFLTFTVPIYYGCPNLNDYFDERAFIRIDIQDLSTSIDIIDDVMNHDSYIDRLKYVKEARAVYLNEYHVFSALTRKIEAYHQMNIVARKKSLTVNNEEHFMTSMPRKIYNELSKLLR